jgi:hypothetical protein
MPDSVTKIDALWALTYIADYSQDYIQLIIDNEVIPHVIPMLASHRYKIMLASMRMLGNIATGTDEQTQVLIDHDILINIRFPLMYHKDNLRRMALWCLSNITVGTHDQVQAVYSSGLLQRITDCLALPDVRTRREAIYCLNNLIMSGNKENSLIMINAGAIGPLFTLIMTQDEQISLLARQSLKTLLEKANQLVDLYAGVHERLNIRAANTTPS